MGRAPCCEKVGMKRGRWTAEEDRLLSDYIHSYGEGSWRSLPKKAGLKRCGKSCRLRWINYLREDVKRGNITSEEEELIVKLHSSYGNRWSLIATKLPGRTDNEIKNYWNSHLSRKLHYFMRKSTVKMNFISPPLPKPKSTQETKNGAVSASIPAEKEEEETLLTHEAYKTNFSINNGDSEAARGSIDQNENFDRRDSQNLWDGKEALDDLFVDRDVDTRESQNLRNGNEGVDDLVLSWLLEGEEDLLDLWP